MTSVGSPLGGSVDHLARRTGLSGDAVAILMIVAGVLVIAFPRLLAVTLGVLLIVLGGLWLFTRHRDRQAAGLQPSSARPPPPTSPPPGP